MNLDKPGPQPHNAGITPGFGLDAKEVTEADTVLDRLRAAEHTIERMRNWALRYQRKAEEQDLLTRMVIKDYERLAATVERMLAGELAAAQAKKDVATTQKKI